MISATAGFITAVSACLNTGADSSEARIDVSVRAHSSVMLHVRMVSLHDMFWLSRSLAWSYAHMDTCTVSMSVFTCVLPSHNNAVTLLYLIDHV